MRIFTWLRSLFAPNNSHGPLVYPPRERNIFKYWNGTKEVLADPVALYKKVMAVGPELGIAIKVAQSQSKDNMKAHDEVCQKIRWVFNVTPPADPVECENTLTQTELVELLDEFLAFCDNVKKNSQILPTSSASSAAFRPSADASVTTSSSDSGSTANAPSTDRPKP